MSEIDDAETCMLAFINAPPLEPGQPIPPPFPLSRRKVWWAENITNLPHGQAPSPRDKRSHSENEQGGAAQNESEVLESTQNDSKSRARKAREAMSNRWKRVSRSARAIFDSRHDPLYPEPEASESDSSEDSVYEESPRPSVQRRPSRDRSFPVWDLSGFQQMADGTWRDLSSDTAPLLQAREADDDATRVDSATTNFLRRASSTLWLTKLGRQLRRSSNRAS